MDRARCFIFLWVMTMLLYCTCRTSIYFDNCSHWSATASIWFPTRNGETVGGSGGGGGEGSCIFQNTTRTNITSEVRKAPDA